MALLRDEGRYRAAFLAFWCLTAGAGVGLGARGNTRLDQLTNVDLDFVFEARSVNDAELVRRACDHEVAIPPDFASDLHEASAIPPRLTSLAADEGDLRYVLKTAHDGPEGRARTRLLTIDFVNAESGWCIESLTTTDTYGD